MTDSPTGLGGGSAHVRSPDHRQLGDGATRDPVAIAALVECQRRRQAAGSSSALVIRGVRRGYTRQDHERAEALRDEARSVRRIAAAKTERVQRELVEREAQNMEDDAERIVPLRHARTGWR